MIRINKTNNNKKEPTPQYNLEGGCNLEERNSLFRCVLSTKTKCSREQGGGAADVDHDAMGEEGSIAHIRCTDRTSWEEYISTRHCCLQGGKWVAGGGVGGNFTKHSAVPYHFWTTKMYAYCKT